MSQGALPGFRDFYPEQLASRNYLIGVWRDVARRYGFVEYDGPLLEDLELVLVQIVQLSPGNTPQDRELIEKTLQQDHVMTRLRTAIPAGPQRGS